MSETPSLPLGSRDVITLTALLREILAEERGASAPTSVCPALKARGSRFEAKSAAQVKARVRASFVCTNTGESGQLPPRAALR